MARHTRAVKARRPRAARLLAAGLIGAGVVGTAVASTARAQDAIFSPSGGDSGQGAGVHRHAGHGLSLELAPLTRDQVVAFLVGRGMGSAHAAQASQRGCFFRSAIGHAAAHAGSDKAPPTISLALGDWRVETEGAPPRPPGRREDWDAYWAAEGVSGPSAVAFHWALFPSEQVFAPGDHNWGFLTFMLAPGSTFALEVAWRQGETSHSKRFEALECAP